MKKTNGTSTFLKQLGLTDAEIKVYTSLLSIEESLIVDITKTTDLYRPAVYKAIEGLKEKGLIRISSKGKRQTYTAEAPDRLEILFKNFEQTFFNNIEDLHQTYETSKTKLNVSMAEGEDAITDAYSDVIHSLNKGETYYRYSSLHNFLKKKYIPKDYEYLRDKKGLERLIITGKKTPHQKLLGRSIKIIPPEFDLFQDEINVILYKDKVAIIDYPSKTTMTIKHAKFAEFQKKLFKLLYSKL
ncbi:MAG: helix-turn-helix domain-containing protein [Candidatus Pacebacteria bacterium]|nr:helix-turn-helix domain-containing protein [Candidatus Paceibacterota bacterium]